MYEISCVDPVLIVNPRFDELVLNSTHLYLNGSCRFIDDDLKFKVACGESASKLLHVPFAKQFRLPGNYTDVSFQDFLDSCYLVSVDGEIYPVYQYVPCGHCSVCNSHKMVSYVQRARFAVEESGQNGLTITLKYNDAHLPKDGVLDRRDVQLFMKRLKSAVSRMYKLYGDGKDFWRDAALKIKVIYAGEYGKLHNRPHWHLLLFGLPYFRTFSGQYNYAFNDIMRQKIVQFAWRRSSDRLSFVEYRYRYPKAYKSSADYDLDSIGFVWIKEIGSSSAVRYALKYALKNKSNDDFGSVYGTSCNLGVKFVKSHFSEILSDIDCKFKFKSVVDGELCQVNLSSYYLHKLLPSYSKLVPKKVRQAFVDFVVSGHFLVLSEKVLLPDIKRELSERFLDITSKFSFLSFDFRSAFSRPRLHRISSYYAYDVQVQNDLPFLVPQFINSADFLVDIFNTYEASYKILSESAIDYDEVCRQLALRDSFFARFQARSRSSILLDGINYEDEMSDLFSRSVL